MISYGEFLVVDYLVLSSVLIACLGIGFYFACFGGKQKTSKEYFKGDGNMSMVPVVLSMIATYISSNGMLGIPAEIYHFGFNYWFTWIGAFLGIPFAVYGFMPVFYELQITSVFEYIERRFNTVVRRCGSVINIISMLMYASFVTYGPALALSQVTGLNMWGSIITTTIIGTIYTSIGGIKAVMWTDSLQVIIFTAAIIAVIIKGCIDVGGISAVIERSTTGKRVEALSFSLDPRVRYTFWGIFIQSTLGWCQGYGTSQVQVQRYLSCRTIKAARWSVYINGPGLIIVGAVYCLIGLTLYANYWNCDPFASQQIQQPDQIFPLFVMKTMSGLPGMAGLFVAGVYSASLSTISSVYNSLAAITIEDHVKPRWKNLSDERATYVSKFLAVAYGIFSVLLIAAIMHLGSIVQASYYLLGGTYGATFGLFTLGFFVPWANSRGALLGIVCGIAMAWWVSIGNQIYKPVSNLLPISLDGCDDMLGEWTQRPITPRSKDVFDLYKISYFWISPLAWFVVVVVGAISSPLFKGSAKVYDINLLSPFVHYIMKRFFKEKYKQMQIEFQESNYEDKITLPCMEPLKSPEFLPCMEQLKSPEFLPCMEPLKPPELTDSADSELYPKSRLNEVDENKV